MLMVRNPPANAGDVRDRSPSPGWGRSPGGRHDNPLQHSCLENNWTEEPGRLQSIGLQRVRQLKRLSAHTVPQSVLGVLGYCVRGIHEQTLVTVISVAAVFFSKALPLVTSLPEASVAD